MATIGTYLQKPGGTQRTSGGAGMEFDYDADVQVGFAEDLTYGEVAPLLDAFAATPVFTVRASRVGWSGPAGGGPEIGLVVEVAAGIGLGVFAKSFCEELGKDAYKAVRLAILGIVRRLRERDPDQIRAVVAFAIRVDAGSQWRRDTVSICFGDTLHASTKSPDEWTEEWFVERLRRAQAIVDAELGQQRPQNEPPIGPENRCEYWLK